MSNNIRVLIGDDHTIVRSGVRMLLEAETDIEVVGEAGNGVDVVTMAGDLQPDVIIMDIAMPGMDGLEATRHIKADHPHIHVLVLTMHRTDDYFFEMLKAGASGYVLKGAQTNELIRALRTVSRGEVFLYPTMAQRLVQGYLHLSGEEDGDHPALSQREKEILQLMAEGYSNKEIAGKLVISPSTVHTHRGNLFAKLGLSTRRELIQYARKRGLISNV